MAASAVLSVAVGSAAATSVATGGTIRVPPNQELTIALNSSTDVRRWLLVTPKRAQGPMSQTEVLICQADNGQQPLSTVFTTAAFDYDLPVQSLVSDINNNDVVSSCTIQVRGDQTAAGFFHRVKAVVPTSTTVTASTSTWDGVTVVAGDRVLLAGQTTPSQNGIWVFGSFGSAVTAALTRPSDYAAGAVLRPQQYVYVESGTNYEGSQWKSEGTGAITVDTTSVNFFPRVYRFSAAVAANASVITTGLQIKAGAGAGAVSHLSTVNNVGLQYTASSVGAGSVLIQSSVATTVYATVFNW